MIKKIIPVLCTVVLISGMTAAAVFLDNREIIFPEIAAIAAGALIAPDFSWNSDKKRILIYISVCAVLGVAIVRWLPVPVEVQMITAYLLAQILLVNSKTTFAPMISAMVLPVMLQTETPIYILSAVILTSLILMCRWAFEKSGITEKNKFDPLPRPEIREYRNVMLRTLFGAVLIVPALVLDFRFAAAPPLLVAFTEFTNPKSKARNTPVKSVALITLCACFGAFFRYIFCIYFKALPLYAAAALTILAVILLMKALKMFIPPAGAVSILAMLIPETAVPFFPLQILVGSSAVMLFAKVFFGNKREKR